MSSILPTIESTFYDQVNALVQFDLQNNLLVSFC